MSSPMASVGLDVDEEGLLPLVRALAPAAEQLGEPDGLTVLRWQDPSGARLVIGHRGATLVDVLPSFASTTTVRLDEFAPANEDVAFARLLDEDGEQLTTAALEVEERRLLAAGGWPGSGRAALVALGVEVTVHDDDAAFAASDASLLGEPEEGEEPIRLSSESFISFGVFHPPEDADSFALLSGTVRRADRRTNTHTGQGFVVAEVRSAGFDVTLCLAASEHGVPAVGNVVSGRFLMVASTGAAGAPAPRRRWWRR